MMLPLARIRLDGGTQPRVVADMFVIDDYAEQMRDGAVFPSITVFFDGTDYWLADGFHRVKAALKLGLAEMDAEIRQGSVADARWYSYSANKNHGLKRSNEDKVQAVKAALQHPKATTMSNVQIAEHCGVGEATVRNYRDQLTSHLAKSDLRTGRDGRTINVANIGKKAGVTEKIIPAARDLLRDTIVVETPQLVMSLAKLGEPAQQRAAELIASGEAPKEAIRTARKEAFEATPKPPPPDQLPSNVTLAVADAAHLPLADESVDLALTSPPYGLGKAYGTPDDPYAWPAFMETWLREMYRVARPSGRLALNVPLDTTLGGHRPTYPQAERAAELAGWQYRFLIVWLEPNQNDTTARGSFASANAPHVIARAEAVLVCNKGEWQRGRPSERTMTSEECVAWSSGIWHIRGESSPWDDHPAAFPRELPERLIKLLSFPGDTVLDPFVGSGTTALAALRLGRKCLGYDISPDYIASAKRRLAQEASR